MATATLDTSPQPPTVAAPAGPRGAVGQAELVAGLRHLTLPGVSAQVIPPEDDGPGSWAGAPCAVVDGDGIWLAYRLRRPIGSGRGFANVIAHSRDGAAFDTVAVIPKDDYGAESLERPALVRTPEGRWRLYLSCATEGTAHWRVDLLEAASPAELPSAPARTVLPGSDTLAVKDPVIVHHGGRWHLWASVHPLTDPDATDRMWTEHATSPDGASWTWRGTALAGRAGQWDSRGVRIAAVVLGGDAPLAVYDGRATAEQNWEEQTGLAVGSTPLGTFRAQGTEPAGTSPHGAGGLRYVSLAALPDGTTRLYGEVTRTDGAHELRTCLLPSPSD